MKDDSDIQKVSSCSVAITMWSCQYELFHSGGSGSRSEPRHVQEVGLRSPSRQIPLLPELDLVGHLGDAGIDDDNPDDLMIKVTAFN